MPVTRWPIRGSHVGVTVRITYGSATIGKGGDASGDLIGGFTDVIGSAHNDRITDTVSGTVAYGGNDNTFDGGTEGPACTRRRQ